jgi:hypothetical protein
VYYWLKASGLIYLAPLAFLVGLVAREVGENTLLMPTLSVPEILIPSPPAMLVALAVPVLTANALKLNEKLPLWRSRRLGVLFARAAMPWLLVALIFAGCATRGYFDVHSMTLVVNSIEYFALLEAVALFRPQWAWSIGPVVVMFAEQLFGRFRQVYDWMSLIHQQATDLDWQIAGWAAGCSLALHLGAAVARRFHYKASITDKSSLNLHI